MPSKKKKEQQPSEEQRTETPVAEAPQQEPEQAGQPESGGQGINKTEAVRQALEQLGRDAMPVKIRDFIKDNFGLEMSTNHISNIKSSLVKKAPAKNGKKPKEKPAAAHMGNGKTPEGISLDDIQVVKQLTERVGPDKLHALIDILSK